MVLLAAMDLEEAGVEPGWAALRTSQRGNGFQHLCAACNNPFARLDRAYVDLAKTVAHATAGQLAGNVTVSPVRYPLRILKSALRCFVSSLGLEFTRQYPWIRPLLLSPAPRALPRNLNVFAYALASRRGGRATGLVGLGVKPLDETKSARENLATAVVLAEFAFWPLGLVLAFDDLQGFPLRSITGWHEFREDEEARIAVDLPVHQITTPFPLDFRTVEEVARESGRPRPFPCEMTRPQR